MNPHALRVLEYDRIREILAAYTATPLGKSAVAELEPRRDLEEVRTLLQEAREMRDLSDVARVPLAGFRDVAGQVRGLVDGGRPAEPDLLYDVLQLLRGSLALAETLTREPQTFPALERLGSRLEDLPELRRKIEATVDARDGIRDDATPKLAGLRRECRRLRESLRERINHKRADSRLQKGLQREGVNVKNDRYLLAVKAEFRHWVPGVIRDRSYSGSTFYIEPQELVLDGDQLLDRLDDERDEVQRVLWELTRAVLAEESALEAIQVLVTRADLAFGKAEYARAFGLTFPEIVPPQPGRGLELELEQARHAYLLWLQRDTRRDHREPQFEELRDRVVPLDLRLGAPHRLIVVTGPNTGGKTVALKTVGLNVLMALSGMPIPAAAGARVPLVSDLYADIGDEQSIEQSLSTFSSHLSHLVEILRQGDDASLVLLDELGAGTDPLEGAALATALLEHFKSKGWHAIITTHLTSLKEYAFAHEEVQNAAMEFDARTLEPTFRLVTGLPGSSHALEIARRSGIPAPIVDSADARVAEVQAPTRELIDKMVDSHRRMEKERRRMERLRQRAQGERRAAEAEREEARSERETLRVEADDFVDTTLRDAQEKLRPLVKQLQNVPKGLQPVVDELRWAIDLLLTGTPLGDRREAFARSLKKEDEVYVPKFRERCKVRKINKSERIVTVLLNGIPTEIGFDDVTWVDGG